MVDHAYICFQNGLSIAYLGLALLNFKTHPGEMPEMADTPAAACLPTHVRTWT
jgi:hypothetical protein